MKKTTITKIASFIFLALLATLIGIGSTVAYQERSKIVTLFERKPEPFTELYFENNTHLPVKEALTKTTSGYTTYSFKFTVHNLENKDMVYPYEVYRLGSERVEIAKGEISLKKNASKTLSEIYSMPNTSPTTEVIVNLINKKQNISFWMEEQK